MESLLDVRNLATYFYTYGGVVRAVDDCTFKLNRGETLGLVGETGCGKTVTALSIVRLVPSPGKIVRGRVVFGGEDLLKKTDKEMRNIRGSRISMIFQDPMSSLNPVFTIGEQVVDIIRSHENISDKDATNIVINLLKRVGLPEPEQMLRNYPYELSGGMQQRVMIAMSLLCHPKMLIADEPTTSLDVTIAAQILDLIREISDESQMSVLYITHDLGVVAQICDKVAILYSGKIVEFASVCEFFRKPAHPYTRGLLNCLPSSRKKAGRLMAIEGTLPSPINPPPGCRFHPRCPMARQICKREIPEPVELEKDHSVSCVLYA